MPQLVKGGKFVYGWSEVGNTGKIAIPNEALAEYNLVPPCNVILLFDSTRSGGFTLTATSLLKNSVISHLLAENSKLAGFQLPEGETVTVA
jgi:hypothetical protein